MKSGDVQKPKVDVVVLMAGEGRRMLPLTNDRPKSLLCGVNGHSILNSNVQAITAQNWDATIIPVIGHGRMKVLEELSRLKDMAKFDFVFNPFYATAGPLVSLWLGLLQSKNEGLVIINGDTFIEESLVNNVAAWCCGDKGNTPDIAVCVSHAEDIKEDDMKVLLDERGCFSQVGKNVPPGPHVVISAGVVCVRDAASKNILKSTIDSLVMDSSSLKKNYYWHNLLNVVKGRLKIDFVNVLANSWHEVDTISDLDLITDLKTG